MNKSFRSLLNSYECMCEQCEQCELKIFLPTQYTFDSRRARKVYSFKAHKNHRSVSVNFRARPSCISSHEPKK
jgi:hypothetical protein